MITVIKKKGINPMTKTDLHFIQWTRVSTIAETALAKKMARGGTYSVGEASGVMLDFPQYIIDELLNGNAVRVAGLGEFKLKVSAKADPDPEKVTTRGAQVSVLFEADPELQSRLQNEADFKIVTTPTPEGQKDADSAETPSEGESTNGQGGEGQGGEGGQGTQTTDPSTATDDSSSDDDDDDMEG
jgi:predicted histone-like DNA-binding protein